VAIVASFLFWLVVVELLGLAALPLTLAVLPRLADRGYGLVKLVGILAVTYLNYLLGSLAGWGNNAPALAAGAVLLCAGGLALLRPELRALPSWFRRRRAAILAEEGLFLLLFAAWALVRAAHPGILSTEKPMDRAMMTASHKAASFPPYDPWLAGTTINYYYGGYLAVGTLVTLTGVAAPVGYNLALALLFALVGSAAYSVAYGLTRNARWAVLGPVFALLIGNLNALSQYLAKGTATFGFFNASRVVEPSNPLCGTPTGPCTITEFPAFSFLLGDLHPHVIALPFTILAIGVALNLALAPAAGWDALARTDALRVATMVFTALSAGALYFMNSWDWPTYLLLIGAALLVPGLVSLDRRALAEGVGVAVGVALLSYVLYASFHRDFKPQYNSFGVQLHGSPANDVFTMFGLFLLPVAAFIIGQLPRGGRRAAAGVPAPREATASVAVPVAAGGGASRGAAARGGDRSSTAVLEREPDGAGEPGIDDTGDDLPELPRLPMPSFGALGPWAPLLVVAALGLSLLLGVGAGLGTAGLLLPFLGAALYLATREAHLGGRENAFALLLCTGGIGLIVLCDAVFLKDLFCGADASGACRGGLYRMNTVFKFYYQAWTLLALGAAYGLYALSQRLRGGWRRFVAPGGAVAVAACGGLYLTLSLFASGSDLLNTYTKPVAAAAPTLDGAAYLDSYSGPPISITNAIPADAAAIRWLNANVHGHPTIAEADQVVDDKGALVPQDYWPFPGSTNQELMMSRVSTFTGLPAILGSGGSHEGLWHNTPTDDVVGARFRDLQTLYTSADPTTIKTLLQKYNVGYLYLGQIEAYTYYGNSRERVGAALARFKKFGAVVYNEGGVTILRTTL